MNNKNISSFPVKFRGDNTYIAEIGAQLQDALNEISKHILSENNTIVCTDPYIFKSNNNYPDYDTIVTNWLVGLKAKKIVFYIENTQRIFNLQNTISNALTAHGSNVETVLTIQPDGTPIFHDRYWICLETKQAVAVGTSLNGLGNRVSSITILQVNDVNNVLRVLKECGIEEPTEDGEKDGEN